VKIECSTVCALLLGQNFIRYWSARFKLRWWDSNTKLGCSS